MSCGTILKNNPDVLKQSQRYFTITSALDYHYKNLILPKTFNGPEIWKNTLSFPFSQYKSGDWAFSTETALLQRLNLYAYGSFFIPSLSSAEILLMIDKPPIVTSQPKDIFQGYSIYDALEYGYLYGFPVNSCFNINLLKEKGIDMDKITTFDQKMEIVKQNSELLDRTHCLIKYNDKYLARRLFRVENIGNVGYGRDDTLDEDIISIKSEIYKYGPVIAGFLMFDDFVNSYDGKTIYTGPPENSKEIGGHSVVLFGWGEDPVIGSYWIAMNGWDKDWGLMGFFYIKMGIKQCMLEKNVVSFTIDIPNSPVPPDEFKTSSVYPELYAKREKINPLTFYTEKTTKLLEDGTLSGRLGESSVTRLIDDPKKLIKINTFFAANVDVDLYIQNVQPKPKDEYNIYLILFLSLYLTFIAYKIINASLKK